MSDDAIDNPLIQRLVVQRLAAPGLLSRESLQRRYEERQHSPIAQGLASRLQQRFSPSTDAVGGSLVWQRASGHPHSSTEVAPPGVTAVSTPSGPAITGSPAGALQRSSLPSTPTFAQKLLMRKEAPGVLHINTQRGNQSGARSGVPGMSDSGALASQLHARYSVAPGDVTAVGGEAVRVSALWSVGRPSNLPVASSVIMRQHDSQSPAPITAGLDVGTGTQPSASVASAPFATPMLNAGSSSALSRAAQTPAISRGSQPSSTASPTVLARKADAGMRGNSSHDATPRVASAPEFSGNFAAGAPMPLVTAAQPFVLQRMMAPPKQSSVPVPYPMPPTTNAIPLDEPAGRDAKPFTPPVASQAAGAVDVDWIAEEVGRRLRQRLQIERERRGIRQWR